MDDPESDDGESSAQIPGRSSVAQFRKGIRESYRLRQHLFPTVFGVSKTEKAAIPTAVRPAQTAPDLPVTRKPRIRH